MKPKSCSARLACLEHAARYKFSKHMQDVSIGSGLVDSTSTQVHRVSIGAGHLGSAQFQAMPVQAACSMRRLLHAVMYEHMSNPYQDSQ